MTILIDFDHEEGPPATDIYDTIAITNATDITISAAAALNGSYGLEVMLDGAAHKHVEEPYTAPASGIFRWRVYFSVASLSMANNDTFRPIKIRTADTNFYLLRADINYKNVSGTELQLYTYYDGGNEYATNVFVASDTHWLECDCRRATNGTSSDGSCEWWLDDVSIASYATLNNYDTWASGGFFRLGARFADANTLGPMYFDDLIMNDTGDYIGPVAGPAEEFAPLVSRHFATLRGE